MTLEDIAESNKLLKEILLRKSDELSGACRNYLENIKHYLRERKKTSPELVEGEFSNREIRKALRVNPSSQKRYNLVLMAGYYIRKVKGKKGTSYGYEVVNHKEFHQLRSHISNVLDNNLKKLGRFGGSQVVHRADEPVKEEIIREISK